MDTGDKMVPGVALRWTNIPSRGSSLMLQKLGYKLPPFRDHTVHAQTDAGKHNYV